MNYKNTIMWKFNCDNQILKPISVKMGGVYIFIRNRLSFYEKKILPLYTDLFCWWSKSRLTQKYPTPRIPDSSSSVTDKKSPCVMVLVRFVVLTHVMVLSRVMCQPVLWYLPVLWCYPVVFRLYVGVLVRWMTIQRYIYAREYQIEAALFLMVLLKTLLVIKV